jgi:LytS/YehU family sensor histidine kinase
MSSITNIKWVHIRKLIKRAILGLAIFFYFFAVINLFAGNTRPEGPAMAMVICGSIFGLFFGNYVSALFLRQKKKVQTFLFVLLPVLSFICMLISAGLVDMRRVTPIKVAVFISVLMLFIVPLGLLISLIYHKLKQQIAIAQSSAAHSKSELQLLQSQLSPHFLFNTLNNLYGISLTEPAKTPGMLLKLSELLRYSVYDVKETFVPLKDELNYLKNYIEFEKIRIGHKLDLSVDIEEADSGNIGIAPMLLVVFVENAFKHAKNNLNDKIRIEISMKRWSNSILFAVKNSHRDIPATESMANKHSGFGLQSAIKRLELLYPNAHDLKIEKEENIFSVMLRLNEKRLSK